jgi:hypothetical protein
VKARRDSEPDDRKAAQGKPGGDRASPPPCACCGSAYDNDAVRPIGVFEGVNGESALIIYPCGCGTTRAVSWDQASDGIRRQADEAQSRRAAPQRPERR